MQTIYLLRHFKVKNKTTKKLNSNEFNLWVDNYDKSDLKFYEINLPKIDKAYVSSQNRAIKTAKYLNINFELLNELVEVEAKAFISTKFKFSKSFWLIIGRILWYFNICKTEKRKDTIKRARKVVNIIENDGRKNILIVSHGLFLKVLTNELKKNKFYGKIDLKPQNGAIYTLKKDFEI